MSDLGYTFAPRFRIEGEIDTEELLADALRVAATVDAVQDTPWPLFYKELDEAFPGSKFILTIRDTDEWWTSLLRHFGGESTAMRDWIYGEGDPNGHETLYKARYDAHNAAVREYFASRPDDLLVMSISSGDGWDLLCPFLGEPLRDTPFPHRMQGSSNSLGRRIRRRLQRGFSLR